MCLFIYFDYAARISGYLVQYIPEMGGETERKDTLKTV